MLFWEKQSKEINISWMMMKKKRKTSIQFGFILFQMKHSNFPSKNHISRPNSVEGGTKHLCTLWIKCCFNPLGHTICLGFFSFGQPKLLFPSVYMCDLLVELRKSFLCYSSHWVPGMGLDAEYRELNGLGKKIGEFYPQMK